MNNMTRSQIDMYLRYAMCRLDDEKREREELAIMAGGGDLQGYRRQRKSLRDMLTKKPITEPDGSTSVEFKKMASRMGFPIADVRKDK